MMLIHIAPADLDSSLAPDLILMLSILFCCLYFLVWRIGVTFRGGIDRTAITGQRRVRFMVSSALIAAWIITVGYLILVIGVLPSYVTLVLVVLLGLVLYDLFRQYNTL